MNHAASLKIDDLVWEKMYVVFGKTEKKQAALNAIAVHCVLKINASFYLFALSFIIHFFSLSTFTGISGTSSFWR